MPATSRKEIKLFYCYAREDKDLRDQLERHLSGLKRYYHLANWHDREILAGENWEKTIDEQLDSADIIFLLISPDFIASDYCYSKEMQRAMKRHEAGTCLVIPILLRPTHWEGEPFGHIQLLPTDAKPITRWPDRDEAFHDVVKEVSKAFKESPSLKTKEAWLAEGLIHSKANDFTKALDACNKAIERDSYYALAYFYRGNVYYLLNSFSEALADFEKAVSIDPLLLRAHIKKGDTLERLQQTRNAYAAYAGSLVSGEKIPQDNQNARFHNDRGDALYGLKLYLEALSDFEQAIYFDPNNVYSYYNKGYALNELERYKEALAAFEQAIHLDPKYIDAYNGKGYALSELQRYNEALVAFERAIYLNPNYANAHYNKGSILNKLNKGAEALAAFKKAEQLEARS